MDQSHDSIESWGEHRSMVVSPHMSPQRNETICGCRCGCGCGCAGDDGDIESERLSDSETAIESNESEDGEYILATQYTHEDGLHDDGVSHLDHVVQSPRAVSHHVILWFLDRLEELQLSEGLLGQQRASTQPLVYGSGADRIGSPLHEPRSIDFRGNAISVRGRVQMISPGPGLGGWTHINPEGTRAEHGSSVYIDRPLRLSAEFQHARGKIVEHMLMPDGCQALVL